MKELFRILTEIRQGIGSDCELNIDVLAEGPIIIMVTWDNDFGVRCKFGIEFIENDQMTVQFYVDWINGLKEN